MVEIVETETNAIVHDELPVKIVTVTVKFHEDLFFFTSVVKGGVILKSGVNKSFSLHNETVERYMMMAKKLDERKRGDNDGEV